MKENVSSLQIISFNVSTSHQIWEAAAPQLVEQSTNDPKFMGSNPADAQSGKASAKTKKSR